MFRKTVLVLAMVAATLALILAITIGGGIGTSAPRSAAPALSNAEAATPQAATGGEFTGSYMAGLPIYRLPPINVLANRRVELARIEREERDLAEARALRKAENARTSTTVHPAATTLGAQ